MDGDAHLITIAALIAAAISFILYVAQALVALRRPVGTSVKTLADSAAAKNASGGGASFDEITKLLEALSKATDSLAKAGPALTSLIAAVLFLAIGAVSAGAFHSSAPDKRDQATSATGESDSDKSKQDKTPGG